MQEGILRGILRKILKKIDKTSRRFNRRDNFRNKLCYILLDVLSFDEIFNVLMSSRKSNTRSKKLSIESLFKDPIVGKALRVLIINQNPIGFLSLLEKRILSASRKDITIIRNITDDIINILRLNLLHNTNEYYNMEPIFKYLLEVVGMIFEILHGMKDWKSIRVFSSKLTNLFEKQHHYVQVNYHDGKVFWQHAKDSMSMMWWMGRNSAFSMKTMRIAPTLAKREIICLIENLSGTIGYVFFDFSNFIKTLVDGKDFITITKILKILLDSITKQEVSNISINVESKFVEFILYSVVSRLGYRDILRFVNFCSRLAPNHQAVILMKILEYIVARYIDRLPTGDDLREIRLLIEKLNNVISSNASLMKKIKMYLEILKIKKHFGINSRTQYPLLAVFENYEKLYMTLAFLCIFEYMNKGSTWCKIVFNIKSLERIKDVLKRHIECEASFMKKSLIACLLLLSLFDDIAPHKYSRLFENLIHILRNLNIRLVERSIRPFGSGFKTASVADVVDIVHRTLRKASKKGILNLLLEYIKQQTYRMEEVMEEEIGMSHVIEHLINQLTRSSLIVGPPRHKGDVISHVILAWSVILLGESTIIKRIISDSRALSLSLRMYIMHILKHLQQIMKLEVPILLDIFKNMSPRYSGHHTRPHHRWPIRPPSSRYAGRHFPKKIISPEELVEDSIIVGRIVKSIMSEGKLDIDCDVMSSILDISSDRKRRILANSLYHAVILSRVTNDPNIRRGILDIVDLIQAYENVDLICGKYTDMSPEIILTFIKILVDAIRKGRNQYMRYLQRVLGGLSERTFAPIGSVEKMGERVGELFNICHELDPNLIECILHLIIPCFRKVKHSPEIFVEPFIKTIGKKRTIYLLDTLILHQNQTRLQIRSDIIDLIVSILKCLGDRNFIIKYTEVIEDKEALLQGAILFGDRKLLNILSKHIPLESIVKSIDEFFTKSRYIFLNVFPDPGIRRVRENIGFILRKYYKES